MSSGRLTLEKGKFWRNGQVVPIEFGNKEQIELMNRKLEEIYALEGGGLPIDDLIERDVRVIARLEFKCPCGQMINFGEEEGDDEDFVPDFTDKIKVCRSCKKTYEIDEDEDGAQVIRYQK